MSHPGEVRLSVPIPSEIYHAIQQGIGRGALQREYGVPEQRARYYLQAYEESTQQKEQTAVILADLHIPDHEEKIIKIVLDTIASWKVDVLILLGDVLGCEALRFWRKPPTKRQFGQETRRAIPVFEALSERVAHIPRKIYVIGNHEERINSYLWDHAFELADLECLSIRSLLHTRELGWEVWSNKDRLEEGIPMSEALLTLGDTIFLHGHEIKPPGRKAINTAKGYSEVLFRSAVIGHVHRSGHWPPRTYFGNLPVYTVGCLQRLNVDYDPFNRWNWGFGKFVWSQALQTFRNYTITSWGEIQ